MLNQKLQLLEYIIIDGNSTDHTPDIIRKFTSGIDVIISENDNGIYDAMNKGIRLAQGEWILFLNAGDLLASDDILVKIFVEKQQETDIIYGNSTVHYKTCSRL